MIHKHLMQAMNSKWPEEIKRSTIADIMRTHHSLVDNREQKERGWLDDFHKDIERHRKM